MGPRLLSAPVKGVAVNASTSAVNLLVRGLVSLLGWRYRKQPIPVRVLHRLRRLGIGQDPLHPPAHTERPCNIRHLRLRTLLEGRELGIWTLGSAAINFLEREVQSHRPMTVVEFGSGVSTIAVAQFLRDLDEGKERRLVLAVEQDPLFAEETAALAEQAGLTDLVEIVVAPLREQVVEGIVTTCYDAVPVLGTKLRGRSVDMVVIDGPSAERGARFATVPFARPHASTGAPFYLDDALRDGELWVAGRWRRLPYVHIDGVRRIGKGILVGSFRHTDRAETEGTATAGRPA